MVDVSSFLLTIARTFAMISAAIFVGWSYLRLRINKRKEDRRRAIEDFERDFSNMQETVSRFSEMIAEGPDVDNSEIINDTDLSYIEELREGSIDSLGSSPVEWAAYERYSSSSDLFELFSEEERTMIVDVYNICRELEECMDKVEAEKVGASFHLQRSILDLNYQLNESMRYFQTNGEMDFDGVDFYTPPEHKESYEYIIE